VVLEDLVEEDLLVMEVHMQAELVILLTQVQAKVILEGQVQVLVEQVELVVEEEQLPLEQIVLGVNVVLEEREAQ
jgi:hypothetical protein